MQENSRHNPNPSEEKGAAAVFYVQVCIGSLWERNSGLLVLAAAQGIKM